MCRGIELHDFLRGRAAGTIEVNVPRIKGEIRRMFTLNVVHVYSNISSYRNDLSELPRCTVLYCRNTVVPHRDLGSTVRRRCCSGRTAASSATSRPLVIFRKCEKTVCLFLRMRFDRADLR